MYRGTTPTYIFTAPEGLDLTAANNILVTFSDVKENVIFTKSGEDLEVTETQISVYLTQEETLKFPNGRVLVQINWTYDEGNTTKRACSEKMIITARKNLVDEVI